MLRIAGILIAAAALAPGGPAADELTPVKAAVLGVVEGVTEYLPVSSTGHLLVTEELLDIGETDDTEDAADTFAIAIQAGAILAVVVLYGRRMRAMSAGLLGRDPDGLRLLVAVGVAFVPAAAVGLALDDFLKDHLFGPGPVVGAWALGGIAILLAAPRLGTGMRALESMDGRAAVVIGTAQVLALWPGISRSLVTIIAALALGFTMGAAVEFSFLLGLATLTAATGYEIARNGNELFDTFGVADPLIGFAVAFASAVIAVRWLVGYLSRHGLGLFGWYRLGVAAAVLGLMAADVV
ncbi:MAG: undecaprenyl-diphosphate phosphatase [Actinomycetota bacterium]